jgi:glutathione synthase/RimK-type ligase-like ATP-grasp enzyme
VKLRVATCRQLPEPDVDEAPLAEALAAGGFDAALLAWDDPAVDWDAPIPTILRSTWNYAQNLEAFLGWLARVAAAAPLWNPERVCRGNVRKRYLRDLAARGVPIVPTTLVERGEALDLAALGSAITAPRIVIKPEVGAGSIDTAVFAPADPAAARHLAALTARGAALVQPYVDSVDDYGERSLVWIDGALSHAVRKTPRFAGDPERIGGPFEIADDERAIALAALGPYGDLLYGRVDMARDAAGRPMVMELELIEPSLFFAHGPGSAARYVAGLARRLGRR